MKLEGALFGKRKGSSEKGKGAKRWWVNMIEVDCRYVWINK